MNLRKWDIHHHRWQDMVAFLAGIWLIATVMATISTITFVSGWLAFLGGALLFLMSAAGLQDDRSSYSWAAAFGGLMVIGASIIAFVRADMFAFWSLFVAGAIALFVEVWAATLKQRARAPSRRRAEAGRPLRA